MRSERGRLLSGEPSVVTDGTKKELSLRSWQNGDKENSPAAAKHQKAWREFADSGLIPQSITTFINEKAARQAFVACYIDLRRQNLDRDQMMAAIDHIPERFSEVDRAAIEDAGREMEDQTVVPFQSDHPTILAALGAGLRTLEKSG